MIKINDTPSHTIIIIKKNESNGPFFLEYGIEVISLFWGWV